MFKCGLFIVTRELNESNLIKIYDFSKSYVANRLYLSVRSFPKFNIDWRKNISTCYSVASQVCPNLDIRLLLPCGKIRDNHDISVVLCDDLDIKGETLVKVVEDVIRKCPQQFFHLKLDGSVTNTADLQGANIKYANCVLGGAFDRLHNGHKILLSTAAMLTDSKLFCGITDDAILCDKILYELIDPLSVRIGNCRDFLSDVKPSVEYTVEPIKDAFGPTIQNSDFDCIVASVETRSGCQRINQVREENGLQPLAIELIDTVNESDSQDITEIIAEPKISSTKLRLKSLGRLQRPVDKHRLSHRPYVIGLTGGIASGKSSISKRLQAFGAVVIDCDKLGHEAYSPGTQCYEQIISTFGQDVVNKQTNLIDRTLLGSIVFSDSSQMSKLTGIVWPAIANMAVERINNNCGSASVVVLDAAVLLDAGWEKLCNEVWVSFVPPSEAIIRLQSRNKLSEENARKRIANQMTNKQYIAAAHVVFCSLWSYEFTGSQVQYAWDELQGRLSTPFVSSNV